jgi:hypothetical protein
VADEYHISTVAGETLRDAGAADVRASTMAVEAAHVGTAAVHASTMAVEAAHVGAALIRASTVALEVLHAVVPLTPESQSAKLELGEWLRPSGPTGNESDAAKLELGVWLRPPVAPVTKSGFDVDRTVISQYANSPAILAIVHNFASYVDPTTNFDAFYDMVWNVDTAQGYGLDVWGRIVGVSRVLHLPDGSKYLGFHEATDGHSFGEGIFYSGGTVTTNFSLADPFFRRLILAKALSNISDGSIAGINQILINLFGSYGNCYVIDNGDMTMVYSFGSTLSVVDFAIVSQSGILPRPCGVAVTVQQR